MLWNNIDRRLRECRYMEDSSIIPAVPSAQCRITAWALGDGRSGTPVVENAATGDASKLTALYVRVAPTLLIHT